MNIKAIIALKQVVSNFFNQRLVFVMALSQSGTSNKCPQIVECVDSESTESSFCT